MKKTLKHPEKARFDAKLTTQQKQNFEYAASIGGFRSLSDFVITAAEDRAKEIIMEHENILASARDKEIFFTAVMKAAEPNKKLAKAAQLYKKAVAGK